MLTLLLLACTDPVDTGSTVASPTIVDCESAQPWLDDGATGVPVEPRLTVRMSYPDDSIELRVHTSDGDVAGRGGYVGHTWVWEPDLPLEPDTLHTITSSFCDGSLDLGATFTTGPAPSSVDLDHLTGRAWSIALADAAWLEPVSLDYALGSELEDTHLLLQLAETDPLQLVAVGSQALQPPACVPTTTLTGSTTSRFELAGDTLWLQGAGTTVALHDPVLIGTFGDPTVPMPELTLRGRVDVRDVLDAQRIPQDVCDLADNAGGECVACPDGVLGCVPFELAHLVATPLDDTSVPVVPPDAPGCSP